MNSHETPVDVSIVMPCLNEAETLPRCLEMAHRAIERMRSELGLAAEIVISDNGSTDGSQEIAIAGGARVVAAKAKGYGHALQAGIEGARGRFIVMGDSDASYDFEESVAMVAKLAEGYELCMGTRLKGEIKPGAMPWKNRYIGNPALTGILNLFFRSGLSDAHSGMRAFTKAAYRKIRPTSGGMEFASELVVKASLLDLKRTEVPISLHPDGRSRPPHLRPWRDGWRHLRFLIMLSPLWLYFIPAALLVFAGATVLTALVTSGAHMVSLGPVKIGDHWAIVGGAMASIGHLAALMGVTSTLYGIREGYRKVSPSRYAIWRATRLEAMLVVGLFAALAGAALVASVVLQWKAADFGALHRIRELVAGSTLITIGTQHALGGFLLSVIAGNDAKVDEAVERYVSGDAPAVPAAGYSASTTAGE